MKMIKCSWGGRWDVGWGGVMMWDGVGVGVGIEAGLGSSGVGSSGVVD